MHPPAFSFARPVIVRSNDRPGESVAEFRVDVESLPWLADHRVQDMTILPGAMYVELARAIELELAGRAPRIARHLSFDRPIILSTEQIVVRAAVREHADGRIDYAFDEGNGAAEPAGRLEITPDVAPVSQMDLASVDRFKAQAGEPIYADRIYKAFRANGNQYGPAFQRIESAWIAGSRLLGKISVPPAWGRGGLHPSLLDSIVQLLAVLAGESRKSCVLRSIEEIELPDGELPDALWALAELEGEISVEQFRGGVQAFDDSGKCLLKLTGVAFSLLDHACSEAGTKIVVSANFTAEPVEDSLKFWASHFGIQMDVEFAPYAQVFPQLLDPNSAFQRNRDGLNVVLLRLESWATASRAEHLALSADKAEQCFRGIDQHVLPNGARVGHWKRHETDYLYKEIFQDECYLRNGIRLPDDATVIDVGANIGMFSLFVMSRCRNPRIYAFEPAPDIYRILQANCAAYGKGVAVRAGVSDSVGSATFTFYENSSVFSGFHADESTDGAAIRAIARNTLRGATSLDSESIEGELDGLTSKRLFSRSFECPLTTISATLREYCIERVDLLKIDAEKSELGVLNGIEERDWPRIEQIVVEIHDRDGKTTHSIESLLAAHGFRCAIDREALLESSGFVNLYATRPQRTADDSIGQAPALRRNVKDFCRALESFRSRSSAPLVLCVCPRTPLPGRAGAAIDAAEDDLLAEAGSLPNVRTIGSASLKQRYGLEEYYDPHGDRIGDIPYTPAGYAAIGTAVCRAFLGGARNPCKVIVLDCDNTLWKGECAESGARGVEIGATQEALQQFMLAQQRAGALLCLCSKNNEEDVFEVFDQRADMVLRREHLAAWRINWHRKSRNLASLAAELNLGLDSFVFVDDNPLDCADVRIHCPGTLTLQLPADAESIPSFLDHVWAFDRAPATREDQNRTRMVRESAEREKLRRGADSLGDFIAGLELRIEIRDPTPDQIARISQLTVRTNQFNFTTIRRSEAEIAQFLERNDAAGLTVRVADRFGDYGLVGVVLYEIRDDRFKVDTFLLSCRVLGRGVEHAVLADVARRAVAQGKRTVEIACRSSDRNAPARAFIESIGACDQAGDYRSYPAERLASLRFETDAVAAPETASGPEVRPASVNARNLALPLQQIAEELRSATQITQAIDKYRSGSDFVDPTASAPLRTDAEAALLAIWRRVLGRPRIGVHDNFFEVGGTSLKAVQVLAMTKKELNRELSIVTLFECPTIAALAAKLQVPDGSGNAADGDAAASRGRKRRAALAREAA